MLERIEFLFYDDPAINVLHTPCQEILCSVVPYLLSSVKAPQAVRGHALAVHTFIQFCMARHGVYCSGLVEVIP